MKALFLTLLMMNNLLIFDFSTSPDWSVWEIENDVVMGGKSTSKISRSKSGHAILQGMFPLITTVDLHQCNIILNQWT